MSDYEQKANDFIEKWGIRFEAKFTHSGYAKWDEKPKKGYYQQERDFYTIVFERGDCRRVIVIESYGQCLAYSGEWLYKDFNPKLTRAYHSKNDAMAWADRMHNRFSVRKNPNKKAPTAYDVLCSLQRYDPGSHENFCDEFGIDPDSIKGLDTYNAVREQWKDVQAFFTDEMLDDLNEIQ